MKPPPPSTSAATSIAEPAAPPLLARTPLHRATDARIAALRQRAVSPLTSALVLLACTAAAVGGWYADGDAPRIALGVLLGVVVILAARVTLAEYDAADESRRLADHVDQLVQEDPLTGVANRRGLSERLPVELARAARSGQVLTVAMLDLDHFKRFNDRRGHGAGDELLRGAAQAWRRQLRPSDLLARYGGEEFTLVLPACDADQACQLIDRLRTLVPERQTFSAGVAAWRSDDGEMDGDTLLRMADLALLSAKRTGRNRTVVAGREPQIALPLKVA